MRARDKKRISMAVLGVSARLHEGRSAGCDQDLLLSRGHLFGFNGRPLESAGAQQAAPQTRHFVVFFL